MDPLFLSITWLVLALLLVSLFSGLEAAFVNINRLGIELRKKQGKASGVILSKFLDEPYKFIGTCLVGITLSSVVFALLLSSFLNAQLWPLLQVANPYAQLVLNIFFAWLLVSIVTQLVIKPVFRAKSDMLLSVFARLINFFYKVFYPVAALMVNASAWMLKYVFNVRVSDKTSVLSSIDLEHFYQQNRIQDEDTQDLNTELFENALSLPNVKIRQCLIPRTEVEGADIKTSIADLKQIMINHRLSKLVVYDENIDSILGYVHQLDLFKSPVDIQSVLLPIPAVPESMSAMDLITKFSKERKSIAWVVDEFGGTAGIVTMEDVLEEIFGEIKDEYDVEEFVAKQIAEDEYLFSGRLEIDYLKEKFDLDLSANKSETLSGFIIAEHETIPRQKERIIIDMYEFEILNVSDTRIEMVKLKVLR